MEDAAMHSSLLQDHEWWVRDQNRDKSGNTAGRVPLAINTDHPPTTWEDLGIDPSDPLAARKWTKVVSKDLMGLDLDRIMAEEAQRQRIAYNKIR